jgi:hypothetical protein
VKFELWKILHYGSYRVGWKKCMQMVMGVDEGEKKEYETIEANPIL